MDCPPKCTLIQERRIALALCVGPRLGLCVEIARDENAGIAILIISKLTTLTTHHGSLVVAVVAGVMSRYNTGRSED